MNQDGGLPESLRQCIGVRVLLCVLEETMHSAAGSWWGKQTATAELFLKPRLTFHRYASFRDADKEQIYVSGISGGTYCSTEVLKSLYHPFIIKFILKYLVTGASHGIHESSDPSNVATLASPCVANCDGILLRAPLRLMLGGEYCSLYFTTFHVALFSFIFWCH